MYNRLLLSLVFCFLFTANSLTFASTSKLASTKLTFEQHQIIAPFKVSLPIIAVDLITNDKFPTDELVIIGEDEEKQTWLAVYAFDELKNDFVLLDKLRLAAKYFAFDVGENLQELSFLAKK